jgi:hypothetical protein
MSLFGQQQDSQQAGQWGTPVEAAEPEERSFVVHQKDTTGMNVSAEKCRVTDEGTLIFTSNDSLVIAFSPSGWTFVEEAEDD